MTPLLIESFTIKSTFTELSFCFNTSAVCYRLGSLEKQCEINIDYKVREKAIEQHCVNCDTSSQWEMADFDRYRIKTPESIVKNWHS